MATIKAAASKNTLKGIIEYVTQEEKTDGRLLSGINCTPDTVLDEMEITKLMWDKTGGRQYKHFVQSYHKDEKITPEKAHEIALELAQETLPWRGFEVLIATHIDKEHIHTHFIINSVNFETGYKLQWKKSDLEELKQRNDAICAREGLHIPEKGKTFEGEERTELTAYSRDTYEVLKKSEQEQKPSYIEKIYSSVKEEMSKALNRDDFILALETEYGISVTWSDTRKHITFTDIERQNHGEKKCKIRNSKLQEYFHDDFSKEAFERCFAENLERWKLEAARKREEEEKARVEALWQRYRSTRDNTWDVFAAAQAALISGIRDKYQEKRDLFEANSYVVDIIDDVEQRKMHSREELENSGYFEKKESLNADIREEKEKLATLREYQDIAKSHQAIVQSLIKAGAEQADIDIAMNRYEEAQKSLEYFTNTIDDYDLNKSRLKVAKFSLEQAQKKTAHIIQKLDAAEVSLVMAAVDSDYQDFVQGEQVMDIPELPIPEKRSLDDKIKGAEARSDGQKQRTMESWREKMAEYKEQEKKYRTKRPKQQKKKDDWEIGG